MRRNPQEKTQLSYEKDRRNNHGESPHRSRRSIPRRKAFRNRANRHRQNLALRQMPARLDDNLADQIEADVFHYAPKVWNKIPDKPLRVHFLVAVASVAVAALTAASLFGRHSYQELTT